MPKVWKGFGKNSWGLVAIILVLGSLPGPIQAQFENVETELEYEEEEPSYEEPQVPQIPLAPDPSLPINAPPSGTEPDKPTIFKLPICSIYEVIKLDVSSNIGDDEVPYLYKLQDGYSVHKSPPLLDGEPIPVEFSMLIFNVFDIREIQEEITLEVNYKLYWKDTRLSNWTKNIDVGQKFATISTTLIHRIWHPDIFIDHIKRVTQPQLISPASSLRIYKDGSLRYTARTLLVLTCRMNFHYYPADTQECNVTMKSFAFSTKQINLQWRDGIGALLAKSIDVHNFDVALQTHEDYLQTTKSNNFSALVFGLRLRRKLSYHVIQTYVPSTLFTVVSWLSFLVPADSTPGRMAICVTTLLTVTAMFGSVKQNTPNVSYIKALDVWMFFCIVFIFLSLAEFTVVLKLRSMKEKKKPLPQKPAKPKPAKSDEVDAEKGDGGKNHVDGKTNSSSVTENHVNCNSIQATPTPAPNAVAVITPKPVAPTGPPTPTKYFLLAAKIEKYAPRIVPLIFVGFTCFYWPYLLIASQYYSLSTDPEMYYSV